MRWSRLTTAVLTGVFGLLVPGSALAAQSLAVTSPTGFPAGGHPTYSTKIALDSSAGTPSTVQIRLAPGVAAAPSANPSCIKTTQDTPSCQIGTGSVSLGVLSVPVSAYLAPPPTKADIVGIDVKPAVGPITHAGAQLVQTKSGNVQTELHLTLPSSLAPLITGMTLTVDGTLNGKPFNRMPTNCSPGHSQLTVMYAKQTETVAAAPDFKPTGCRNLRYAPQLTGTAHAVTSGAGRVVTTITQGAGQAASAKTSLTLPKTALLPSPGSLGLQNKPTPVGSAVVTTPLLPNPLRGKIFLKGTLAKPFVVFKFPPPAALTLTGKVNLPEDSMTIPVIPDVPQTKLQVTFPGGRDGLLIVGCPIKPAKLIGKFTAQSGKTFTSSHRLTVTGCGG